MSMYKIVFTVPEINAEDVKEAAFNAGAGIQDNYQKCAFETKGRGQFLPVENSNPTIGSKGELTYVAELRIEILCDKRCLKQAVAAIKKAHPYESPTIDVYLLQQVL